MSGRSGTGSWVFGPDNDSHNLIIAQYTMRRRATGWFVLGHVACFIYQSVWFLAKTNAPSVAIMRASASSKPILLLRNMWDTIVISGSRKRLQSKSLGLIVGLTAVYLLFDLTSTILLGNLACHSIPGRNQSFNVQYGPSDALFGRGIHIETVWQGRQM
jgi:hypothetical protein